MFAKKFKPFVNKKIKATIVLFKNLHRCIDEMEHRVNKMLREISIPDIEVFEEVLEKARAKITTFQSCQTLIFSAPVDEESEGKE